ncbi:MAG TPA: AI-2E family transporter [Candidatus Dormibacteraeota bacterium]|nr:AI-2E family transporter [Candidatus Dormibacteraeota bacterium]
MNINDVSNRTVIRILAIAVGFFIVLWLLLQVQRELIWVATASFLALTLNPAVVWLQQYMPKKNRLAAIGSVFILMGLVVAAISSILIPPLLTQSQKMVQELPVLIDDMRDSSSSVGQFVNRYNLVDRIKSEQEQLFTQISKATGSFVGVAQSLFSNLIALIVILTLTFFTLKEGPMWFNTLISTRPPPEQKRDRELMRRLYHTVRNYTFGNLLRSLLIFVATLVPLLILQIPYALPLSIVMGILNLIPLVGATIGSIIVVAVCLFVSTPAAIFMTIYLIVYQQLENNLIQPLIFGRALEISAYTVLAAALIGASLAGLLGAFVAIPIAAGIRILFDHYHKYYYPRSKRG